MSITFRCPPGWSRVFAEPQPAAKFMPAWIKNLPHDVNSAPDEFPFGTIRRCMPVHDIISTGYIIPLPQALHVFADENGESLNWRGEWKLVEHHSEEQAPPYAPAYKLINPWQIITPSGYSTLFIPPAHHQLPFAPLPAIVDTDNYKNRINFPFQWYEKPVDRVFDAGTPFIQAIPFSRERWDIDVDENTEEEELEVVIAGRRVDAINHEYKINNRVSR